MSRPGRISLVLIALGSLVGGAAAQSAPTSPGDCNLDWVVDFTDFALLAGGLGGSPDECACLDLDGTAGLDLHDFAVFQQLFTGTEVLSIGIALDGDDGTEVDRADWYDDGYLQSGLNRMGAGRGGLYELGLRFQVPQISAGEQFAYARLVLPGSGQGYVSSLVRLAVVGVAADSAVPFDEARPSQQPKTETLVNWDVAHDWPEPFTDKLCVPLRRYSPDISAVVNEIVARPGWGTGPDGKVLAVVIEDRGSDPTSILASHDFHAAPLHCPFDSVEARLELYRTLRATFVGRELVSRPTDESATLSVMSLVTLEMYFEWGLSPGSYTHQSPVVCVPGGTPHVVRLERLRPDMRYYYRLRYRPAEGGPFEAGPPRTFHTARARGSSFAFAIVADSHLQELGWTPNGYALYRRTLQNVSWDAPDFLLDMGDAIHSEMYAGRDVADYSEAIDRHLDERPYLDLACHSAPYYLVLGNHEGEQGWRLNGTPWNVAVWAANARKLIYPLPQPDDFYTGDRYEAPFVGRRENYYAWEWGDALFVVLDPYWYTPRCPHGDIHYPGSGDNWDWTLGRDQYDWLAYTLQGSSATFKFVFAHHMTGGVNTYGRGGIEAASHALGGRGSFEWGGEALDGTYAFDCYRPGWGVPIHALLVANGVTIFFHAHDHVFARQELDGVIYQECPQPSDAAYSTGYYALGEYVAGDVVPNTGHVRVTVAPQQVTVDYVRAYLPGDGPNGEVAYSYTVPAARNR